MSMVFSEDLGRIFDCGLDNFKKGGEKAIVGLLCLTMQINQEIALCVAPHGLPQKEEKYGSETSLS